MDYLIQRQQVTSGRLTAISHCGGLSTIFHLVAIAASMSAGYSLNDVPQEILERIALCSVATKFLGPPTAIVPLLLTNRHLHSSLSLSLNPHLYARIFAFKFDAVPVIRRLGPDHAAAAVLSAELQRRCNLLARIRRRTDSKIIQSPIVQYEEYDEETIRVILWTSYLMMLENNGKNEEQLRDYAELDIWLREYWFDLQGASRSAIFIKMDQWPPNNEQNSLAMWLFWFLLKPGQSPPNIIHTDS
jgi:hypothetical protein